MLGVLCWNLTNCTLHFTFGDGRVQTLLVGARRALTTLSDCPRLKTYLILLGTGE
ncbi:hypothetical protein Syun_025978 [Stephania yunnanensis]|uniref:Uncharacterized protein n=1 Tax=Stephania yunnanensis TaxID=152371 RepID=A0AAP0EZR5_9MAGN